MISASKLIRNSHIVLPDEVIKGDVHIEDGRIKGIYKDCNSAMSIERPLEVIEADGMYLMPGVIDIHSDAMEKEIQPRPNAMFPLYMSFRELEKKLAGCGITTMYHSLSLSSEWGVRGRSTVLEIIEGIRNYQKIRAMIDHRIHLRYEVTFLEGLELIDEMLDKELIDFLSFMDHTPGQGQFAKNGAYHEFMMKSYGFTADMAEASVEKLLNLKEKIDWNRLAALANKANRLGIKLASHDDDCMGKIDALVCYKGNVSEFPINIETARYAKDKGIHVCVGAPNIVRGSSHSKNMRAMDAVMEGAADIICSDYLPSSMIPAVFIVHEEGVGLHKAVNMVTLNPAKALGIDSELGSIEAGKKANLVLVEMHNGYPLVRRTIVEGETVYQNNFHIIKCLEEEKLCL
ncbi:MAG: alpha-D-ribose 1-methylphosphonate 5-triphosphate diphosphatase [Clostridia bacterium]|nr:alpha-D-ribose 1-methylphosphonate 5-triphosphate diphosphatase [Clostridia bacterium]